MRFGAVDVDDVAGSVLVHSLRLPTGRLAKGTVLTTAHVQALKEHGHQRVTVLRLDYGDMLEDEAAAAIAAALPRPFLRSTQAATGRVNIHATVDGLFTVERELVDSLNRINPAITLATLSDHAPLRAGDMVATVKIIPLAVARTTVEAAVDLLREKAPYAVKPYRPHRVALVATSLPSLKTAVMNRTAKLLQHRLAPSRSSVMSEVRVPHEQEQLTAALQKVMTAGERPDLVIIFGASAVADPQDVIPAAIQGAGGDVEHVGMPVDPGNLLVLGRIKDTPVLGAPGCARSPKDNGFDWVLNRILAGERPTAYDITGMGVGGLLMEIPSRPQPREVTAPSEAAPKVSSLLLAAGQARRMGEGGRHKLLAEFDGVPLVRRSAGALIASKTDGVAVVTGHREEEIKAALHGLDLQFIHNARYPEGLGSSLAAGFSSPLLTASDGVLVMLADMPGIEADHLNSLIAAFQDAGGQAIVRATCGGKLGNPVILPHATFQEVRMLQGDVGARAIIEAAGLPIVEVEIGTAADLDVDTPDEVIAAGGVLKS